MTWATRSGSRPEYQRRLYQSILDAGADLGLKNFGMRALLCLRLEKHFGTWFREFRPIYGPFEAGLDRFVKLDKPDFIGKAAALKEKHDGPKTHPHLHGGRCDGLPTSWATSRSGSTARSWAGSPRAVMATGVDQSLAQGYIPTELVKPGMQTGDRDPGRAPRRARLQIEPPFDPQALRMRM